MGYGASPSQGYPTHLYTFSWHLRAIVEDTTLSCVAFEEMRRNTVSCVWHISSYTFAPYAAQQSSKEIGNCISLFEVLS